MVERKENEEENYHGYVLILCHKPSKDGKMRVEMDYEGDPILINYLLKSAKDLMDKETEKDFCS